jgi:hypothetical protein
MTEADWLACDDLERVLLSVWQDFRITSNRKERLFACACCRRVWLLLTDGRARRAVEAAERYADAGTRKREAFYAAVAPFEKFHDALLARGVEGAPGHALEAVRHALVTDEDGDFIIDFGIHASQEVAAAVAPRKGARRQREIAAHCDLVRDLFGNPARPAALDPAWLTWNDGLMPRLAEAAYQERLLPAGTLDRDRLAVLADALEEAGCNDAAILQHLRGPGEHVRGCWVIDLLTGRT